MITLHRSEDRAFGNRGWLKSFYSFSFAEYFDPENMGWGNLRVINEHRMAPGEGVEFHGHAEMEIVSYVLGGELGHRDSLGNSTIIRPGSVQRMSAGCGILHQEFNPAADQDTHYLQFWILPDLHGIPPSYEHKPLLPEERRGRLRPLASPDGAEGSVTLHADARILAGLFDSGDAATLPAQRSRKYYVHLARGHLTVNGEVLRAGDAARLQDEALVMLSDGKDADVLILDLQG